MDTKRPPDRLGDFVRSIRRSKNLSLSDVQRQSHNEITASYVSLIENGRVDNPGVGKLRSLARGLGLTEEELFAIARGSALTDPDAQENQLLTYFRYLPSENQKDVMLIVRALHREHGVKPVQQLKVERSKRRAA